MFKILNMSILFLYSSLVFSKSATTTAQSFQTVLPCLTVEKESDLNFGEAPQADPAKTIPPGRSENAENASFEVHGDSGTAFSIILPSNNSVKMIVNGGGNNQEIPVNNFTSYPSNQSTVGVFGKAHIYVGATREKLTSNQKPGKYVGSFTVSIIY
jgi:Domain of unknown function (DUF4402)